MSWGNHILIKQQQKQKHLREEGREGAHSSQSPHPGQAQSLRWEQGSLPSWAQLCGQWRMVDTVCHMPPRRDGGEALSVGWKDSGTMSLDLEGSIQAEGPDNALQGGGQERGTGAPVRLLPRLSTECPRDLGQVA